MPESGATVTAVAENSVAQALGIQPGCRLLAINDMPLRDIIDYRFHSAEAEVSLQVLDPDGLERCLIAEKHPDEPLGLEFASPIFDTLAVCSNHCSFCFIDALPASLRPSLYLRDDDYRLSFLHGSFITLTNWSEADWERVGRMRLSPLYVSVHSTDQAVRKELLGAAVEAGIVSQLQRLARLGITVHAQIVLVPGVNDERVLENTLKDLSRLQPAVASVAVVPVGTTRHRHPQLVQPSARQAQELLRQLARWQAANLARWDDRWVYPADEWYALAGQPYPPACHYGDFPQLENGVGMAALFQQELDESLATVPTQGFPRGHWLLCTGTLALPLLERAAQALTQGEVHLSVLPVHNTLFGPQVTVAGLVGGRDLIAALEHAPRDAVALIPAVMLREELFLDDVSLAQLRATSPIPVAVISPQAGPLVRAVRQGGCVT